MRTDPEIGPRLGPRGAPQSGFASFSGHERNRLFLSTLGQRFTDASALSGLDHPGDSRAVALLDFDRDGWLDVAMVNANAPLFQLFRNRIGQVASSRMLALRFAGSNRAATANPGRSPRDGYGATVTLDLGDLQLLREHRAGEGFAAQNSSTLVIGLGERPEVRALTVRWPSGRAHETRDVAAGTLVTAWEDPAHSPTGEAFTFETYAVPGPATERASARPVERLRLAERLEGAAHLRTFTTMATWCEACRRELPALRRLRARFDAEDLEMFGVPVDENDSREMLEAYQTEHAPVYRLLRGLAPGESAEVQAQVSSVLHHQALPSTLVTDRRGRLVYLAAGTPTVSALKRLLAAGR